MMRSEALLAGYFGYFGALAPAPYYSFNLGAWHLISLNTEISMAAGSAQETWLKNDLAASNAVCTLAYWHKPRWTSGSTHPNGTATQPLVQDLYNAGAELLLARHNHQYERFAPQNPSSQADRLRRTTSATSTRSWRISTPTWSGSRCFRCCSGARRPFTEDTREFVTGSASWMRRSPSFTSRSPRFETLEIDSSRAAGCVRVAEQVEPRSIRHSPT